MVLYIYDKIVITLLALHYMVLNSRPRQVNSRVIYSSRLAMFHVICRWLIMFWRWTKLLDTVRRGDQLKTKKIINSPSRNHILDTFISSSNDFDIVEWYCLVTSLLLVPWTYLCYIFSHRSIVFLNRCPLSDNTYTKCTLYFHSLCNLVFFYDINQAWLCFIQCLYSSTFSQLKICKMFFFCRVCSPFLSVKITIIRT